MSDTPCLESDNHPSDGGSVMRFKVEYEVQMTEDEARELAEEEGTEDDAIDDPQGTTEDNIQHQIEESAEFAWITDKVKVNTI